jgi:hypothetical protein
LTPTDAKGIRPLLWVPVAMVSAQLNVPRFKQSIYKDKVYEFISKVRILFADDDSDSDEVVENTSSLRVFMYL